MFEYFQDTSGSKSYRHERIEAEEPSALHHPLALLDERQRRDTASAN